MNEQENVVLEGTENVAPSTENTEVQVEQIADESAKVYTEAEFNERLAKAIEKKMARREAKIHKEYQKKYGDLENVLKAGTGKDNVEEITGTFKEFYESNGVRIPKQPQYNSNDIEVLARADADEIINSGMDDVIEELDRLTELGVTKMSAREKAMFKQLADYHKTTTQIQDLEKIGVTKEVYTSKEFKDFASKFSTSTPITEIFNIYNKMQPQKPIQTAGSMKSTQQEDNGVKDFYTVEEARAISRKELDKNPKLYEAVVRSMQKWK